ncbi:MAG TPA: hypothetical protein VGY97_08525, partial [Solirubrobacteraceae bacterium]|nr:hypothetical protein [Solirubrobacteraceae bacterium]
PGRAGRGTPTLARASSDQRLDAERFLQRQAALRRGVAPGPRANPGAYRDYPRLSWLVGLGPQGYGALDPAAQRRARLAVDRQLRGLTSPGSGSAPGSSRFSASATPLAPAAPFPRPPGAALRARRARQFLGHFRTDRS